MPMDEYRLKYLKNKSLAKYINVSRKFCCVDILGRHVISLFMQLALYVSLCDDFYRLSLYSLTGPLSY